MGARVFTDSPVSDRALPTEPAPGQNPVNILDLDLEAQRQDAFLSVNGSKVSRWISGTQQWVTENNKEIKNFARKVAPYIVEAVGKSMQAYGETENVKSWGNAINMTSVAMQALEIAPHARDNFNAGNYRGLAADATNLLGVGLQTAGNNVPFGDTGTGLQGWGAAARAGGTYFASDPPQQQAPVEPDLEAGIPPQSPVAESYELQPVDEHAEMPPLQRMDTYSTAQPNPPEPGHLRRRGTLVDPDTQRRRGSKDKDSSRSSSKSGGSGGNGGESSKSKDKQPKRHEKKYDPKKYEPAPGPRR